MAGISDHIKALRQGRSVWAVRNDDLAALETEPEGVDEKSMCPANSVTAPCASGNDITLRGAVNDLVNQRSRPKNYKLRTATAEAYSVTEVVHLCVNEIAQAVSTIPLKVMVRTARGKLVPARGLVAEEVRSLLERPNKYYDFKHLTQQSLTHLLLTGNGFIRSTKRFSDGKPAALYVQRPDGIKYAYDEGGWPVCFIKSSDSSSGGDDDRLDLSQVGCMRLPNPLSDWEGMSPLMAAAMSVDGDREAAEWQYNQVRQGAMPSGAVSYDVPLEDSTWDHRRTMIRRDIEGSGNSGKVLLLDNGAKFTPFGFNAKEVAYLESRQVNRNRILAIYGVPGPVVGFYESSTYNNITTAERIFYQKTVKIHTERFCKALTWLLKEFDERLVVAPDYTEVPQLQAIFSEKLKDAKVLRDIGYELNDINERLELGMPEVKGSAQDTTQEPGLHLVDAG